MAKTKKAKQTKSIIGYGLICVLLVAFLAAALVGAMYQKSSLVQDSVLLEAMTQYFDKEPKQITQADLDSIAYISFDGMNTLSIGGEEALKAVRDDEDVDSALKQVSISGKLKDLKGDLALLTGLKYLDFTGDVNAVSSADELSAAKGLEYLMLDGVELSSYAELATLTELNTLRMDTVEIKDASFLSSLKKLVALSIADTTDYGILRMIVSDTEKAKNAIKQAGITVHATEVLAIKVPDVPGGFSTVVDALGSKMIDIEYTYAFLTPREKEACVIVRVDDNDEAIEALKAVNIDVLTENELFY